MPFLTFKRQKSNLLALLMLILLSITYVARADFPVPVAPKPNWTLQIPADLNAEIPLNNVSSGVHYLLVDTQIYAENESKPKYFFRYAEKVLNQTGVERSSQITVDFDPIYEQLSLHDITIWRDKRAINKLDTARMSLVNREEELDNLLYNGRQTLHVILDDVRAGDVIEYSFSLEGDNPIYNGTFAYSHSLNWAVPLHHLAVTVHWHKPTPLFHQITDSNLTVQTERTSGGGSRYRVEQRNLDAVVSDENTPVWFEPYGRVYFSESKSWREVANWARPLMESGRESNAAIKSLANQILRQHDDPVKQIFAALQYVQEEVRYFGIEIGENSHRPARAGTTLSRRYGDCKDKTMLLLSILDELNIEAHPALVNTLRRHTIADIIPSGRQFNHVIASVIQGGKTYWLDPTRQYQYGGLDAIYQADYGYALVLRSKADALTSMKPAEVSSSSEIKEEIDISAGKDAPAIYRVHTTSTGLDAEKNRRRFASRSLTTIQDEYLKFYKDYYPKIATASPITFADDPQHNRTVVEEQYAIDDFWKFDEDDKSYYAWFYSNALSDYLKMPAEKKRSSPFALSHPVNIQQTVEIKLDEQNWHFDDEDFREDNEFFTFTYAVRFDKDGKKLTLQHTYRSKKDAVALEHFPTYLAALERSKGYINYSIFSDFSPPTAEATEEETNLVVVIIGLYVLLLIVVIALWRIDSARHPFSGEMSYYPVAQHKFIALWLLTFGVYGIYWFYRNWLYIRERDQSHIMPLARGIFYPLWYYPLFKDLHDDGANRGKACLPPPAAGVVLAVLFLILNVSGNFIGYEVLFTCAAGFLMLPLVNCINHTNQDDSAYRHNSRWRVYHYLLTLLAIPLCVITLGGETGLTPSDRVIDGSKLLSHDIKFLQRKGVIVPDEKIIYFYSDAFLSNRDDGNGYTDRKVFSYWQDESGFNLHTAAYADIKNIEVTWGDLADHTIVKIILPDDSWFILYASTTKKKDKVFVADLMSRWKKEASKTAPKSEPDI